VAYSFRARIVESQQPAVAKQQRNGVFCAVRADGCARNSGISHAIAKQKLHNNRGTVFSVRSMPRLCNELRRVRILPPPP
jgi:hypothetical protein